MVNGRGIVDRISGILGYKWFLLITELEFLPIAYRKELEKKYTDTEVRNRGENFKKCALDCIREWMKTPNISRLSDGDKIRMLLHEVNKLKDFQVTVQEIANAEDIDLSDTSFLDHYKEQVTAPTHSLLMEATGGVDVSVTRTITSGEEIPHSQMESWPGQSDVIPMVSPRGAPWSFGDESASPISYPMGDLQHMNPVTPRDVQAEIKEHEGVAIRYNESKRGQSHLLATAKEWTGQSGTYSDGSSTSLGTYVHEVTYDTPIRIRRMNHKFPILDVCQRLPEENWRENGKILGLDDAYLSSLEDEDVAERYYLILKRWVEKLEGTATFSQLRDHLQAFGGDTALLVLEARLSRNEEILVKAIQHDFL